jgi:hypothetical protein
MRKSHDSQAIANDSCRPENLFAGHPETRIPAIYARHSHVICTSRRKQAVQSDRKHADGPMPFHHTPLPRKGGRLSKQAM